MPPNVAVDRRAMSGGLKFAEKLLLQQIVTTLEFAAEVETRERDKTYWNIPVVGPASLDFSSAFFRLGRADVIASAMLDVNDSFGFRILSHNDFRKGGHLQRFGARYKAMDNLAFTLDYNMLTGSPWSYYGLWKKNDMVVLTAEYSF
jgi:hypothetical protein